MKRTILTLTVFICIILNISAQESHKTLLIIDIQDFYFPGGKSALVEPEKAAANAALLLADFREKKLLVVHVRHNSEPGGKIRDIVKPLPSEKIISKDAVNSFLGTDLLGFLKANKTDTLVICGMQTHMCVEAATRAASDYGFKCILIHDACATKDLEINGQIVKAEEVQKSFLAALDSFYSKVKTANQYLYGK